MTDSDDTRSLLSDDHDIDMVDAPSRSSGVVSHSSVSEAAESPRNRQVEGSPIDVDSPLLLQLPVEIRHRIWQYCFFLDTDAIKWPTLAKRKYGLPTGLLRTCKILNKEVAPVLYECVTPLFTHPSDANMFLWNHNKGLCQKTRQIRCDVRDRDLSLWTTYLTSNKYRRSLQYDYPNLNTLLIVLHSLTPLRHGAGDVVDIYRRWLTSSLHTNLISALKERIDEGLEVKIIFGRFADEEMQRILLERVPEDFAWPQGVVEPRIRTKWTEINGVRIALDATLDGHPWTTTEIF